MSFNAYLMFAGNCREAFTRYNEIFGGELTLLTAGDVPPGADAPPGDPNLIMHAALKVGDALLMASDDPTVETAKPVEGMQVSYGTNDADEARRVFAALAEGGNVTMPISETFWSPAFGMCVDRFGTPWMVSAEGPQA
ncbi:MAG TPA: VOC family protein [Acidimicrobiales bacterium]|nr:VOC family protein [Acidimicrobiales bacterium]